MEWVKGLHGQIVGLDTAPLIYYIEQNRDWIALLRPFFSDLTNGQFQVVTSVVTLLEVLTQPLRRGDEVLAHKYNDILLSSPNISTQPVTHATALEAAELRARYSLKTPDAIQLSTAILHGATTFLTHDRDFRQITEIAVLRLTDINI